MADEKPTLHEQNQADEKASKERLAAMEAGKLGPIDGFQPAEAEWLLLGAAMASRDVFSLLEALFLVTTDGRIAEKKFKSTTVGEILGSVAVSYWNKHPLDGGGAHLLEKLFGFDTKSGVGAIKQIAIAKAAWSIREIVKASGNDLNLGGNAHLDVDDLVSKAERNTELLSEMLAAVRSVRG